MTLTEFLTARLDEDEVVWTVDDALAARLAFAYARQLREVEAKRAIVKACTEVLAVDAWEYDDAPDLATDTLVAMAGIYADHPDYDEAWRP